MKVNESRYISLFVVNGCIKKLLSIGRVDTYFSQSIVNYLFLNIFFNRFEIVGLLHIAFIVINYL